MTGWQTLLELVLVGLLAAMLFRLMQLERAIRAMDKDRSKLDLLFQDFGQSTHHAEDGLVKLREAVESIGLEVTKKIAIAGDLEKDLIDVFRRGDTLAARLEGLVRSDTQAGFSRSDTVVHGSSTMGIQPRSTRSKAEQDLLRALRAPR